MWSLSITSESHWELLLLNQLRNDRRFAATQQRAPWITSILPHEGKVYVGDRDGKAVSLSMLFFLGIQG